MSPGLQFEGSGLVTSVGCSTAAVAAAIRAGLSNPQHTRFLDWGGEWISAHVVPMEAPDPRTKLLRMVATAIDEAMATAEPESVLDAALVLCLPEASRPRSSEGLDASAIQEVGEALGRRFSEHSSVVTLGRVGGLVGLHRARLLLGEGKADEVIVAGVDSHVDWPALSDFENRWRLLTSKNSNGFMPGEAAAAVRVVRPRSGVALRCDGLGFAVEPVTVDAELPLRADGLVAAIRAAAREAQCRVDDFDLRISGLSGEHYFFKEAALAATRLVREPSSNAELWHPADCVGEVGAAAGPLAFAIAAAATAKGYAPSRILCHFSGDGQERSAAFLQYGGLA